jgi:hypothetical protein
MKADAARRVARALTRCLRASRSNSVPPESWYGVAVDEQMRTGVGSTTLTRLAVRCLLTPCNDRTIRKPGGGFAGCAHPRGWHGPHGCEEGQCNCRRKM